MGRAMIGERGDDASGSRTAAADGQTGDLRLSLTPALNLRQRRIKLLVLGGVSHYQR
jgi:hypothetical protein